MRLSQKLVISPDTVPGSPKMKVYAKFWEIPEPVWQYLLSFETASKKFNIVKIFCFTCLRWPNLR